MKTKLTDLTEHLFEMIEKLNDDDYCKENDLAKLTQRAEAMTDLSDQIIKIQDTQLKAIEIAEKCGYLFSELPSNLGISVEKKPQINFKD